MLSCANMFKGLGLREAAGLKGIPEILSSVRRRGRRSLGHDSKHRFQSPFIAALAEGFDLFSRSTGTLDCPKFTQQQ